MVYLVCLYIRRILTETLTFSTMIVLWNVFRFSLIIFAVDDHPGDASKHY